MTEDPLFHLLKRLWDSCLQVSSRHFVGLGSQLLGWSSFYSNGKLGWAEACGKLGEVEKPGKQDLKKKHSNVMERVQTLNLSPAP